MDDAMINVPGSDRWREVRDEESGPDDELVDDSEQAFEAEFGMSIGEAEQPGSRRASSGTGASGR